MYDYNELDETFASFALPTLVIKKVCEISSLHIIEGFGLVLGEYSTSPKVGLRGLRNCREAYIPRASAL